MHPLSRDRQGRHKEIIIFKPVNWQYGNKLTKKAPQFLLAAQQRSAKLHLADQKITPSAVP